MSGPQNEWLPLSGELSAGAKAEQRKKIIRDVVHLIAVVAMLAAFFYLLSGAAEARQPRFSVRTSNVGTACRSCNVQKVVAAPVVHHAAPVVAAPVVSYQQAYTPPVQNFFYSVGQPLVQQSQMAAAVKDALAEYRFQATVDATINGSVQAAGQAIQQQQWTPPPEPMPPVQEPPTFSQTAPSQLEQHCAKCHANGAAKGGFSLDGADHATRKQAAQAVIDGRMPKDGPLPESAQLALVRELLAQP